MSCSGFSSVRGFVLGVVVVAAASCGGGGGDDGGTTAPGSVARVDITAPTSRIEAGQNMQTTVRYYDASSSQLSGRTVTYGTSNSSVATVNETGLVTSAAPGSVTITATVDGVVGNLALTVTQVPIFFIAISPPLPSVRVGETTTLTAQPQNAVGLPLTGRTITWSSANVARATVTQGGVVTGITSGNAYIRAAADGRIDSVNLRVRSLVTPSITGASSATLLPNGTGTITGANFGATIADNVVEVNGAPVVVTAATTTSITFTVPSKSQLPCTSTGPAKVTLIANGDTALTTMPLQVATARVLAVGESQLFTSEADLLCNEYTGSGGKYLVTAFNYASSAGIRTSFQLTGHAQAGVAGAKSLPHLASPAPQWLMPDDHLTRHLRAHSAFMNQERQLAAQLGNPRLKARALRRSRSGGAAVNLAAVSPPAVGDNITYRMRRVLGSTATFDEILFRVVYSGTRIVMLEDPASPRAGQMDAEYVRLGEEFDLVMYDQLLAFGDPLVVDSALDNNGRLLALFSPRVNGYTINGQTNQILGFVQVCDFFPRQNLTLPDNTVIPGCPASNEAEAFYSLVPDPNAGWSIPLWRRLIRGTLIHEAKHISSYAWRYFYDASALEEIWLEEATAQQASEIWARSMYSRAEKQDLGWADGPRCDYAPSGGTCLDPAEGILHHYGFFYRHLEASESKSILDNSDTVVYGSSWAFMRYVTDVYAPSEAAFLSSIVQVQNDRGTDNVASKSGTPFSELFGMFSLASAADNYPGASLTNPKLRLESWNSRDLFQNMSTNLIGSDGSPAYPLAWPLRTRNVSFGSFNSGQSTVGDLRGGSFVVWELSGTQTGPQALAIRSSAGGPPPQLIGMAIVRIQ